MPPTSSATARRISPDPTGSVWHTHSPRGSADDLDGGKIAVAVSAAGDPSHCSSLIHRPGRPRTCGHRPSRPPLPSRDPRFRLGVTPLSRLRSVGCGRSGGTRRSRSVGCDRAGGTGRAMPVSARAARTGWTSRNVPRPVSRAAPRRRGVLLRLPEGQRESLLLALPQRSSRARASEGRGAPRRRRGPGQPRAPHRGPVLRPVGDRLDDLDALPLGPARFTAVGHPHADFLGVVPDHTAAQKAVRRSRPGAAGSRIHAHMMNRAVTQREASSCRGRRSRRCRRRRPR